MYPRFWNRLNDDDDDDDAEESDIANPLISINRRDYSEVYKKKKQSWGSLLLLINHNHTFIIFQHFVS